MAWARLDDKFHSHPSTWEVGLDANGLYVRGISYAADQLTDGFLPEPWVMANLPATRRARDGFLVVERLVNAGLWEKLDNGYLIVGYLDYNPTRESVLKERNAAAQRMARVRGRAA